MGTETKSTTPSPNGKRSRDPEDDVYVDNLHSHKRYLSEMMASSLNGLSVGDTLPEAIMDSPVRSESMYCLRDELSLQYSPMSEDLDDARYCETPMSACSSQSESRPTSPVSPYRYKPVGAYCYSPPGHPLSSNGTSVVAGPSSQPRQRGSETEGRLPSSPSDICHSSDLRKTALLRSVQMRTQPSCSSSYPLGLTSSQESMQTIEVEARSYSYMKPLYDVREYQVDSFSSMACKPLGDEGEYHGEGPSSMVSSKPEYSTMHNNEARTVFSTMHSNEAEKPSCSYMKPLDDEQGYHGERCSSMGDDSETVFTETQEPMLSTEAKPMSCSFMKPLDDGRK